MFLFLGEDLYGEESFFFSCFCRDSHPLPVPSPPGGSGPANQMVYCLEFMYYITKNDSTDVFCLHQYNPLVDLSVIFVFIDRFNISPLSVNVSTTEFSLLATPPKVNPENTPEK